LTFDRIQMRSVFLDDANLILRRSEPLREGFEATLNAGDVAKISWQTIACHRWPLVAKGFIPDDPRWNMSSVGTSCIRRPRDFRFIAVHPVIGRPHLFATIRAPDTPRSSPLGRGSTSFRVLSSSAFPLLKAGPPNPRNAHYRNASVTAVKNVNLPYSRHYPMDAKCPLAGIPIVDFGGESYTGRGPPARIHLVNRDLIHPRILSLRQGSVGMVRMILSEYFHLDIPNAFAYSNDNLKKSRYVAFATRLAWY